MRRIFILILLLIGNLQFLEGQTVFNEYEVNWSDGMRLSRQDGHIVDIFGIDDDGFYTLSTWNNRNVGSLFGGNRNAPVFTVDYFSNNLKKIETKKIDFSDMTEKRDFESLFQMKNNRFYLFTSYLNSARENVLEARLMKPRTLALSSNQKELHRLSYKGYSKNNSGSYGFKMSRDSSRLLVYYNLPYEKKASEKFGFKVYDQFLKPVWDKEITLPYTDELFNLVQIRLDDKGDLYVIGKVFRDRLKDRAQGRPNYDYVVIAYRNNGKEKEEYEIKLADKFVTDVQITVDESGNIICAGFYSELGFGGIKGTFYATVDAETKTMTKGSFKEFDVGFIVEGERNSASKQKQVARGKETLTNYFLDELIRKESGGAILIAEQFYERIINSTNTNGNFTRSYTKYFFNDLIIVSIDAKGEIEWAKKIDKNQETINDNGFYSSYYVGIKDDQLYVLFNDHEKNLDETRKNVRTFNARGGVANLVSVNSSGELKKYPVVYQSVTEPMIRPVITRQVNDELIVVSIYRRDQRIGKINLNKKSE